jgi:DNA-binding transcriptional regulator YhcF (GntR family)
MLTIKERIEKAQENLEKAKTAKTTAEVQKAEAEKQLQKVVDEMTALGVTPENIQAEIDRLEKSINENLDKIEANMPQV